jgi:hypothetical protein
MVDAPARGGVVGLVQHEGDVRVPGFEPDGLGGVSGVDGQADLLEQRREQRGVLSLD